MQPGQGVLVVGVGIAPRSVAAPRAQASTGRSSPSRSEPCCAEIVSIWEQPAELPAPGSSACCYIWKLFSPLIVLNALTRGVTNKTLIGRR